MTRRLACADFTFPLLPHENVLKLIAMLGFEGVDIAGVRVPGQVGARAVATA
jgi:hypothetical protein